MAILGNIIKSGISIRAFFQNEEEDVEAAQIEQLRRLLKKASETAFGRYYGFESLLKEDDPRYAFRQNIPVFDYHLLNDEWWEQQHKLPSITWPGKPEFFALSSGTTGKNSKQIPVTTDLLQSMRKVGIDLVTSLQNYQLPDEVFEKELFILSSSSDLKESPEGFFEGEISGINVHNFPGWYDFFYRPGKEIAMISDWDQRLKLIVDQAHEWDIGAMAGIPSWILMILKAIISHHKLNTIHDLWPSLGVYSTGGVAFEPYRKNFDAVTARPLTIIDTYLASEGFIGYSFKPGSLDMKLAYKHGIYYEFIPFDSRGFDSEGNILEHPEVHFWGEVEEGKSYALIISTCAGAWRYMIGDTIRFTDKQNAAFVISGRTKYFLNVVGSQLSEEKINAGINELSDILGTPIDEFCVAAVQDNNGDFYHQWVVVTGSKINNEKAAGLLDGILQEANKNYKVAREKALKGVKVLSTPKNKFYNWLESRKKKGGQAKTPKVMKEEMMVDLLKFLKKES